jgi:hypothetical protein
MERLEEIREENFADALEIENDVRRLAIPGISEPALGLSGSIIAAQMLDWDEADVEEYFSSLGQTVPLLSLDTLLGRLAAHTTLCVREARSLDAHVVAALRQPDKWGLLFDGLFPHMESISAQATPDLRVFGAFSVLLSGGACGSERRVVSVSAPKLAHADDASEMVVVIFGFGGSDADQLQVASTYPRASSRGAARSRYDWHTAHHLLRACVLSAGARSCGPSSTRRCAPHGVWCSSPTAPSTRARVDRPTCASSRSRRSTAYTPPSSRRHVTRLDWNVTATRIHLT